MGSHCLGRWQPVPAGCLLNNLSSQGPHFQRMSQLTSWQVEQQHVTLGNTIHYVVGMEGAEGLGYHPGDGWMRAGG